MNKNEALFKYLLRIGDSSLIHGQRLAEWCGHGPFLEEDLALTNISLDLIGQAKAFLEYAGKVEGKGKTEDDLAFFRNERNYFNALITEQPKGDFAFTIVRSYLLSCFNYHFYLALANSKDENLAAIATKALKEVTYHLRHTSSWMERLGGGTPESNRRAQEAIDELWRYTGDIFDMDEVDEILLKEGIAIDLSKIKTIWEKQVITFIKGCELKVPEQTFMQKGSKQGKHTEHLGFILAEMQSLPREVPEAKW